MIKFNFKDLDIRIAFTPKHEIELEIIAMLQNINERLEKLEKEQYEIY